MTKVIESRELDALLFAPGIQSQRFIAAHIGIKTGKEQHPRGRALAMVIGQEAAIIELHLPGFIQQVSRSSKYQTNGRDKKIFTVN